MYLQEALKNDPARFAIQGLTRTPESYEEAFSTSVNGMIVHALVQEEHIRSSIVGALPVKNGNVKRFNVSMMLQHSTIER